jgi:hypothetical protein
MQLLPSLDERKIVTRALEKCLAHAQGEEFAKKRQMANCLLDKILEPDLRLSADELDDLSEILSSCKIEIKHRIAAEIEPGAKAALQEQRKTLEHAADKVTEVCMMA